MLSLRVRRGELRLEDYSIYSPLIVQAWDMPVAVEGLVEGLQERISVGA